MFREQIDAPDRFDRVENVRAGDKEEQSCSDRERIVGSLAKEVAKAHSPRRLSGPAVDRTLVEIRFSQTLYIPGGLSAGRDLEERRRRLTVEDRIGYPCPLDG